MIPPGFKYATLALHTGMSAVGEDIELAPGLIVTAKAPIAIPEHWTTSLGTFAVNALAEADVHITAFAASTAPEILDEENERLRSRVEHVYAGLLLGTPGVRVLYGRSMTGAHRPDREVDLRSTHQLNQVYQVVGFPRDARILPIHIRQAYEIGEGLREQRRAERRDGFGDFARLKRCISAMYACIESRTLAHRLHQAVRVVEGVMGAGHEHFNSAHTPRLKRHVLRDWQKLHALPYTLYTIRSKVEHLYGEVAAVMEANLIDDLEPRAAYVHFAAATCSAEVLAHALLGHVIRSPDLWSHFSDDAAIPHFWDALADEQWTLRAGTALQAYQHRFDVEAVRRSYDEHLEDAANEARFHT